MFHSAVYNEATNEVLTGGVGIITVSPHYDTTTLITKKEYYAVSASAYKYM